MATINLSTIRAKARAVAQLPNPTQATNQQIDDAINLYYQYRFPEELRLLRLQGNYSFYTSPNIASYTVPQDIVTFEAPAYCGGQPILYFQDQSAFYNYWSKTQSLQQLATANGGAGPYTGTATAVPLLRGSILVADLLGQERFTDPLENGVLVGSSGGAGTVNYITGAISVTFAGALASGTIINLQDFPYTAARPSSMLYFKDKFILRNVPDQVYEISIQTYRRPTEMIADGDAPELLEWWDLLAVGGAVLLIEERMDFDQLGQANILLEDQLRLVNRRTLVQLMNQSTPTIFNSSGGGLNNVNSYPYSS